MRVLITGGFGFVGARVAQLLIDAGHQVRLGTRKLRPVPPQLKGIEVCCIKWESRDSILRACSGVDAVIHAAGMNASDCAADPTKALLVNGVATANLVEAAILSDVNRFFYLSTAHVYASPLQGAINEASVTNNLHPYATSHLAGELSLLYALKQQKISGSVLRLSNAFGPPVVADTNCWMLLANGICRSAVEKNKMVLDSSGVQMRDFVPLSAVCEDILKLLDFSAKDLPSIINLGSWQATSVLDFAILIQERCANILGIRPALEIGLRKELAASLNYMSLHSNNLRLGERNIIEEIDQLIYFCRSNFENE